MTGLLGRFCWGLVCRGKRRVHVRLTVMPTNGGWHPGVGHGAKHCGQGETQSQLWGHTHQLFRLAKRSSTACEGCGRCFEGEPGDDPRGAGEAAPASGPAGMVASIPATDDALVAGDALNASDALAAPPAPCTPPSFASAGLCALRCGPSDKATGTGTASASGPSWPAANSSTGGSSRSVIVRRASASPDVKWRLSLSGLVAGVLTGLTETWKVWSVGDGRILARAAPGRRDHSRPWETGR